MQKGALGDPIKVSIITICLNAKETIEHTIKNVIAQTYPHIEYIVIDGGSTDGTVKIISKYSQKIFWWCSEKDQGIADAFNKGIAKASGDLVGIVNADDWYAEGTVATVVEAFKANPDAGFVFGDLVFCDRNRIPSVIHHGNPDYHDAIRYTMPPTPHPTVFVRKEVYIQHGGFDTNYKIAMDYELLRRFSVQGVRGVYIPKPLTYMGLGGYSDRNYHIGYWEVMTISIKYGYPGAWAFLRFVYKTGKSFFRVILQTLGMNQVVAVYRRHRKGVTVLTQ
ncbi:glycosyltransferase family 2 protein [Acetonema longum]|uniref:Glycosyl transferase family 2 n=1 Tax=Acetonema longum DSM 6540 TaxID=1009370 RepID=F7NNR5_9FIRM|nr:glycosyltransferase family 2 protein [Acetonema longum]EGO62249.1 glycosyl transferase family 2 [Acetonema longum DSM 6540]